MFDKIKNAIPNAITLMNLLSGTVAIFFAFHVAGMFGNIPGWQLSATAILAAAVFDFCDGASARMLGAYSTLGKELDSLSDLVSFGVAPTMLLLNTLLFITGGHWVSFVALFIAPVGALRLAKFNIDTTQTTTFSGLPIPANALFWIGFCGFILTKNYCPGVPWLVLIICVISLLMVAPMKMFSLKFKNFDFKENFSRYVIIVAAIASVFFYGWSGFMWTILLYILISALRRN